MSKKKYRLEMQPGQYFRDVVADGWRDDDGWLIFYYRPAIGGIAECWRVRKDCVVSIETSP